MNYYIPGVLGLLGLRLCEEHRRLLLLLHIRLLLWHPAPTLLLPLWHLVNLVLLQQAELWWWWGGEVAGA